jgi:sugar (glycoside-pentoside-hexuronide) transporter
MTFYMLITSFLQIYMTDIGIPAMVVGAIFIAAKGWDAINDPLFGVIVDKTNMKSGKFIPWVRLSTLLIPISTIFLFASPADISPQIKIIWAVCGYLLWDISYTICDVPIFALATSMTDTIKERDKLFVINRFFTLVGGILVTIAVPLIYPNIGWRMTAVIISVMAAATMIPIGFKAKERFFVDEEKNPSIKVLVKYFITNKPLLIFNGAIIVLSFTNMITAMQGYAAIYCLGGPQWISVVALVATLPMLIVVVFIQKLILKIEKRTVFLFALSSMLVVGVIIYFVGYDNIILFLVLVGIRALFAAVVSALILMFTADCAEYGNYVTGERAQGVAFSIQTFTAKITATLSSSIGMFILGFAGFVEGQGASQSPEVVTWIWRMYTIFPIVSGSITVLILLFGYKLRTNQVSVMIRCNKGEITKEEAEVLLSETK